MALIASPEVDLSGKVAYADDHIVNMKIALTVELAVIHRKAGLKGSSDSIRRREAEILCHLQLQQQLLQHRIRPRQSAPITNERMQRLSMRHHLRQSQLARKSSLLSVLKSTVSLANITRSKMLPLQGR